MPKRKQVVCDLVGCANEGFFVSHCGKNLCTHCHLKLTRVCLCDKDPRYWLTCPFCREPGGVPEGAVKHCLWAYSSNAAVAENACEKREVVIAHRPSDAQIVVKTL